MTNKYFYQGRSIINRWPFSISTMPEVTALNNTAGIRNALERSGLVKVRNAVPFADVLTVNRQVNETIANDSKITPEDWMKLTLSEGIQTLCRGKWIQDLLTDVIGERGQPESATYLRVLKSGFGSLLHTDIPQRNGPDGLVLKVWIPLTNIREGDANIFFLKNSNRPFGLQSKNLTYLKQQWTFLEGANVNFANSSVFNKQFDLITPKYFMGDILIFDGYTIHGSFDKLDDSINRISVDMGWQFGEAYQQRYVGDTCEDFDSYSSFLGSPNSWDA